MTGLSSPATVTATLCLQCVVIRFLHAKGETVAEIHRQLFPVCGEDVMNRQNVAKWCREFEAGRSDVHDEGNSLSLMKSSEILMKTFVLTDA
jgi:hypothetical protein